MVTNGRTGVSAVMPARGEASRRAAADRTARHKPERVRAIKRATRSAMRTGRSRYEGSSASLAMRGLHGGRRSPKARLGLDGGGPRLLTEDRKKARRRLEGMHGTRNTVHSIAFVGAKRACRCGSRGRPSRSR